MRTPTRRRREPTLARRPPGGCVRFDGWERRADCVRRWEGRVVARFFGGGRRRVIPG